jgi:hypothetical protein
MPSILAGIVAEKFADNLGADRQKALVLGYALGSRPVGLGITLALVKRDADLNPPPVANPVPLSIATASLPDGKVGQKYNVTLKATGGQPPVAWAEPGDDLPASLLLNPATGVITGTPVGTDKGAIDVTIQVTDAANTTAQAEFKFNIT